MSFDGTSSIVFQKQTNKQLNKQTKNNIAEFLYVFGQRNVDGPGTLSPRREGKQQNNTRSRAEGKQNGTKSSLATVCLKTINLACWTSLLFSTPRPFRGSSLLWWCCGWVPPEMTDPPAPKPGQRDGGGVWMGFHK